VNSKTKWKPRKPYSRIKITTSRLTLRPFRAGDFESWIAAQPERTRAEFGKMLRRYSEGAREHRIFVFGLFNKKGKALGSIDFFVLNRELRWGNLGYEIYEPFRGNGYATEAAQAGLKLAFGPLNFHRLEAACEPRNRKSMRVALKAGFLPEGLRRKFFSARGGVDMKVFGINAIDYRAKRP
jgi:RimJ/RimL family protein N-acetyltransferase